MRIRTLRILLVLAVLIGWDIAKAPEGSLKVEVQEPVKTVKPVKQKKPKPQNRVAKVETKAKPTAKPKPVATERTSYPMGCERYRPIVAQYKWNVSVAMAVMREESGCNPNAANWTDRHDVCTGSFGLFQISCHSGRVFDPARNVAIAWQKYQARGWQPWGVCNSGKVRCY
jgi:hypothetical protein